MSFLDATTTVKEGNMTTDLYLSPQTNINIFHPVVAILSTVLGVSHSAKPLW
jgi:hypothetical protein